MTAEPVVIPRIVAMGRMFTRSLRPHRASGHGLRGSRRLGYHQARFDWSHGILMVTVGAWGALVGAARLPSSTWSANLKKFHRRRIATGDNCANCCQRKHCASFGNKILLSMLHGARAIT